jgi:transcriptional regulator with XRE-family HTH domain
MAKTKHHRFNRDYVHLLEWRKFRGLTQEQVAERTCIDQSTVQRIEAGRLPFNEETLERFALAFGCDMQDLFMVNPLKPDAPKLVYDRLRAAPKELQDRAIAVLDALLKAG